MNDDAVLARRARAARLATRGRQLGYTLFTAAIVLFVVAFAVGFPDWTITAIVACLVLGSVMLAPAIVVGYGVRAADREDRERSV